MTVDPTPAFSKRTMAALIIIGGLAFLGALGVAVFGDGLTPVRQAGPTSYSRSALGHRAFSSMLRQLGIPVSASRFGSLGKAGSSNVLVVAEPRQASILDGSVAMLLKAPRLIYALPKRAGRPHLSGADRIAESQLLPLEVAQQALDLFEVGGRVTRGPTSDWKTDDISASPTLGGAQLIEGSTLEPIVWTDRGILVGRKPGALGQYVLADPDIIATHGLVAGKNAFIAATLVARARAGGAVVFDETTHGLQRKPSIWLFLFENPMLVGTVAAGFALVIYMWSATGRFGEPREDARRLEAGKQGLIDNMADLLLHGRHVREIAWRYFKVVRAETARGLNMPAGKSDDEIDLWLDRIAESRGVTERLRDLRGDIERLARSKRIDQRTTVGLLARFAHWKQEMLNES